MSELACALDGYLATRRGAGYKLERAEKLLRQFLDYCAKVGAATVTAEVAVAWAGLPQGASPGWQRQRLSVVRQFAAWRQLTDPATQVPPADALGSATPRRAVPYLYSDDEIAALIAAAETLRWPLGRATYATLVGLLAVTGMRVGEAIRADREDLDVHAGWLRVRQAKLGKSRQLALSPSALQALQRYGRRRDELCPAPTTNALLVSSAGTRLLACNVEATFRKLVGLAGLRPRSARCRPRLHDLRHSFAVATLVEWYRAGVDVAARLPALSTYLGHVDPKATYWYLSAAPELMALAADRLEQGKRQS